MQLCVPRMHALQIIIVCRMERAIIQACMYNCFTKPDTNYYDDTRESVTVTASACHP